MSGDLVTRLLHEADGAEFDSHIANLLREAATRLALVVGKGDVEVAEQLYEASIKRNPFALWSVNFKQAIINAISAALARRGEEEREFWIGFVRQYRLANIVPGKSWAERVAEDMEKQAAIRAKETP